MCEGMDEEQVTFTLDVCVPEAYWPMRDPADLSGLRHRVPRTWLKQLRDRNPSPEQAEVFAAWANARIRRARHRAPLRLHHALARAGKPAQRDPQLGDSDSERDDVHDLRHRAQGKDHEHGVAAVLRGGLRLRRRARTTRRARRQLRPGHVRLLKDCGVAPGWRCAEVGPVGGSVAAWLADAVGPEGSVVALDIDISHLDHLARRSNVEVRRHDIVAEPIGEATFDLVHTRLVIEHLPEPERLLEMLAKRHARAAS